MVDPTYLKAHCPAASLRSKKVCGDRSRSLIGRTKVGMNTWPRYVVEADVRTLHIFMTLGQVSDHIGAAAVLGSFPQADSLLADRGFDADWFRDALKQRSVKFGVLRRKLPG